MFNQEKKDVKQDILLQIGEKVKVEFIDETYEGLGVCKINAIDLKGNYYENFPIFVDGALAHEKGFIEITKVYKKYAVGKIIKLFEESYSIYRAKPMCENYYACGGCNIMHMNYDGQLAFKRKVVTDALERIANITDVKVEKVIGMEKPTYYRNKVQMPVAWETYRKAIIGFYKRDTHEVMPITKCYIQNPKSCDMANFIKNILNEYKVQGYDENHHTGVARHVVIKMSRTKPDIMVIIVAMTEEIPTINQVVQKIINRYPEVSSLILNINNERGSNVLSEKNIILYGKNYIEDELCGLTFKIGATSFFQVNNTQTEILYNLIKTKAGLTSNDEVIDAYCGIGTISLVLAPSCKHVYGIEIVKEAIDNAKENALNNHIDNVSFYVGKAEEKFNELPSCNVVVIDPPRKGCEESLLRAIIEKNIKKIIYVSCNPTTLARDLRIFIEARYRIKLCQPVDMFPYSCHVETLVILEKN